MARPRTRPRKALTRAAAALLIALALAAIATVGLANGWFGGFQRRAADAVQPRGAADPSVAVVVIDARSIDGTGRPWPWARSTHAELVRRLDEAGASVVVLDLVFSPETDQDDALGDALAARGNRVLAAAAEVCAGDEPPSCDGARHGVPRAARTTPPVPDIRRAAPIGHSAIVPDPVDGVVRSVPAIVEQQDRRFVPSLALAAYAVQRDVDPTTLIARPNGVQVGNVTVPTDERQQLRVSYAPELINGAKDAPIVSAADVLAGDPAALDRLRGRVVFVGVGDPGVGDQHLVPLAQRLQPGVLVHANAYNTIATAAYLSPASSTTTILVVFGLTLIVSLAVMFLRLPIAGLVATAALVGLITTFFVLSDRGTVLNLVWPLLGASLSVPLAGAVRYVVVDRERREVIHLFSRYVPETVADQLIDQGLAADAVTGSRVVATTLFCDLRGFTALSASLSPAAVRRMLELYYEYATAIVFEHDGTLMQFVGDEVFAVFGAPLPMSDGGAGAALSCARALQERRGTLNATLAEAGFAPLDFGIGVNTGEMIAAHVGTAERRQYTVLGDTVNTGARLCSQARIGEVVLADSSFTAATSPPPVDPAGPLQMKGVRSDFTAWRMRLADDPRSSPDAR